MEIPKTTSLTENSQVRDRSTVVWTASDGIETVIAETEEGYRVLETT